MERKSKFREFFGQFAESGFYADLAKTVMQEVLRAAVLALTGSVTYYITSKVNGGKSITHVPASSNNDLSSRAFGNEPYSRNTNYAPSVSNQSSSFPGFGNR